MIENYIIIAVVAYLLGSIPFGYILVRIFRGQDIRSSGSGNIGATNVARTAPFLGVITLLLDALKGSLAVLIGAVKETVGWAYMNMPWSQPEWPHAIAPEVHTHAAFAALFAVLGHMFPMWLKFRGGKGVATAVGALAVLAPDAMLVSLAIFVLTVGVTRYVSLGSILGALVFPIAMRTLNPEIPWPAIAITGGISILILLKHHQNIRRLLSGTENRFALKKKAAAIQLANED